MGIVLLVAGNLAVVTLYMATIIAWRSRRLIAWRGTVSMVALMLPITTCEILVASSGIRSRLRYLYDGGSILFYVLWGIVIISLVVQLRVAHRQGADGNRLGAKWPVGWLAALTLIVLSLHLATIWYLDAATRQRIAKLHDEAGAIAVSLVPPPRFDQQNAAQVYQQAFERYPKVGWSDELGRLLSAHHALEPSDEQVVDYLEQHLDSLALIHRAARMPTCYFEHDLANISMFTPLPECGMMRHAGRIVALEARWAAVQDRMSDALRAVHTLFRMTEQGAINPMFPYAMFVYEHDNTAVDVLQIVLDGRNPTTEELREVQLGDSYSPRSILIRCFEMEEAIGLGMFHDLVVPRPQPTELETTDSSTSAPVSINGVILIDHEVGAYRAIMKEYHALAKFPYPEARRTARSLGFRFQNPPPEAIAARYVSVLHRVVELTTCNDARHNTARAALAIHRFQRSTGALPTTLEELVPKYLSRVPIDPFDSQPLRWKIGERGWTVYSIGPDERDDGGALYDYNSDAGDIAFYSHAPKVEREKDEE